jgi:hypothetical protein
MARFLNLVGATALAATLVACGGESMSSDTGEKAGATPATSAAEVPEGAIAVGDDVYMVPIAKDDTGCMMYRAFSPTKAVMQAIHYRTEDDRFVMNKDEAACSE